MDKSTIEGLLDKSILEGLDEEIRPYVVALNQGGIETFESCQGGKGHTYPEPTIRFHGDSSEGFKGLAVAMRASLPIAELRRTWPINDGVPTGPHWEMTFFQRRSGLTVIGGVLVDYQGRD